MGFKNGYVNAVGFGSIMMIIYCTYSLAFWYGAKLIGDQTWNGSKGHPWNVCSDNGAAVLVLY